MHGGFAPRRDRRGAYREGMHEPNDADFTRLRESMVATQIAARGLIEPALLAAFRAVPRHLFVPPALRMEAYQDHPVAIGHGQTISQPYIVALMTSLLGARAGATVLEVGAGSGYQSAILAEMGCRVVALEILQPLADRAAQTLAALGYEAASVHCRDGHAGAPELMPKGGFGGIIVAAAAEAVPTPLCEQLAIGARLVIPVGPEWGAQDLLVIERRPEGFVRESVLPVRFVPLVVRGASRRVLA